MDEDNIEYQVLLTTKEKLEGQLSSQKALLQNLLESGFSFDSIDSDENGNIEDEHCINLLHFHQYCLETENQNLQLMINRLKDEKEMFESIGINRDGSKESFNSSVQLMKDSFQGINNQK